MKKKQSHRQLFVRALSRRAARGRLTLGNWSVPCALGRTGRKVLKREGDGSTPQGRFAVRAVFYRADKIPRPMTALPVRPIRMSDGWCDAPSDRNYNRIVRHPYPTSAEKLWRKDDLYDCLVVLGYNDVPRKRGLGSAVFIHLARDGYVATEGCVALSRVNLGRLLERLRCNDRLVVL